MSSVVTCAPTGKGCLVKARARLGFSLPRTQRFARHCVAATIDETERQTAAREQFKAEAPRPVDTFIDENAILAKSTFPIPPAELIARAKGILKKSKLDFLEDPNDVDVENFVFKAPVVGPLNYAKVREAYTGFNPGAAFSENFPCYHNFWVDPFEPSRVWFTVRPYLKHTGSIMGQPPTYKVVDQTPAMHSFVFNKEGKIVKATIGYPMDRDLGNTGGLGGIFGLLYAIGQPLPFPEGQPYQRSLQFKVFNFIGTIAKGFRKQD